jgi:hypothetical protein
MQPAMVVGLFPLYAIVKDLFTFVLSVYWLKSY